MSQLTPNYNLILLEATDPLADFRAWYNATLTIIDNYLGGGGSGGHTIIDPNGTDMPSETGLQFTGNVNVTDDSVNGKTIVDIPAGSGSGHTIINPSGTSMAQRSGLKFIGSVTVTDDSVNNETIVNVSGGGGVNYSTTEQVIGTWIDGKPLYQITADFGTEITVNANTWANTTIPATDKKAIISAVGTSGTGTCWNFISANCDSGSYVQVYHTRSSAITLKYLTIQYTKTTD